MFTYTGIFVFTIIVIIPTTCIKYDLLGYISFIFKLLDFLENVLNNRFSESIGLLYLN